MNLTYEYQMLEYAARGGQSYPDWLNEHCSEWDIIHINQLPGREHRQVTMRRVKVAVEDDANGVVTKARTQAKKGKRR